MSAQRKDDPRLGSIVTEGTEEGDIVIIGFPFHEGCVRNGGRPGAAEGPKHFRQFLKGMGAVHNAELNIDLRSLRIGDAGDIDATLSLEDAHKALEAKVTSVLSRGGIPFVVGGGNDQSYPNASALLTHAAGAPVSAINIDAHFDVRPVVDGVVHSGTPFRQLLEDGRFDGKRFCEFACHGAQCSAEHAEYIKSKGASIQWFSAVHHNTVEHFRAALGLINKDAADAKCFVSFDIDAIRGADCPGVSCPATFGLSSEDAINIAFASGENPAVSLMDLSEMNPAVEGYRTPRLAVMIFYYFALGFAWRKISQQQKAK